MDILQRVLNNEDLSINDLFPDTAHTTAHWIKSMYAKRAPYPYTTLHEVVRKSLTFYHANPQRGSQPQNFYYERQYAQLELPGFLPTEGNPSWAALRCQYLILMPQITVWSLPLILLQVVFKSIKR